MLVEEVRAQFPSWQRARELTETVQETMQHALRQTGASLIPRERQPWRTPRPSEDSRGHKKLTSVILTGPSAEGLHRSILVPQDAHAHTHTPACPTPPALLEPDDFLSAPQLQVTRAKPAPVDGTRVSFQAVPFSRPSCKPGGGFKAVHSRQTPR